MAIPKGPIPKSVLDSCKKLWDGPSIWPKVFPKKKDVVQFKIPKGDITIGKDVPEEYYETQQVIATTNNTVGTSLDFEWFRRSMLEYEMDCVRQSMAQFTVQVTRELRPPVLYGEHTRTIVPVYLLVMQSLDGPLSASENQVNMMGIVDELRQMELVKHREELEFTVLRTPADVPCRSGFYLLVLPLPEDLRPYRSSVEIRDLCIQRGAILLNL